MCLSLLSFRLFRMRVMSPLVLFCCYTVILHLSCVSLITNLQSRFVSLSRCRVGCCVGAGAAGRCGDGGDVDGVSGSGVGGGGCGVGAGVGIGVGGVSAVGALIFSKC
eukprot:TRINITY_DN16765_c0_g1_i1.p2 TRINITY_DN16765_c0_g1~~TRINITY_DN16765_c0_g1_i1.p2  ORF type:complete len:108 (+),score=13.31 TRINITY_DN16765_c0_g1_i1:133-456(+)